MTQCCISFFSALSHPSILTSGKHTYALPAALLSSPYTPAFRSGLPRMEPVEAPCPRPATCLGSPLASQMAGLGLGFPATPPARVLSPCPRPPREHSPGPRTPTLILSPEPPGSLPGQLSGLGPATRALTEVSTGRARTRQAPARLLSPFPASPGDGCRSGKTPTPHSQP